MMEYASTAMQADRPSPELGKLKSAAERIARATNNVDNFLVRFHGPTPESASSLNGPSTDSYRNDLEAVFIALERLETAVASLDHIG
jgi:hypothetical protein